MVPPDESAARRQKARAALGGRPAEFTCSEGRARVRARDAIDARCPPDGALRSLARTTRGPGCRCARHRRLALQADDGCVVLNKPASAHSAFGRAPGDPDTMCSPYRPGADTRHIGVVRRARPLQERPPSGVSLLANHVILFCPQAIHSLREGPAMTDYREINALQRDPERVRRLAQFLVALKEIEWTDWELDFLQDMAARVSDEDLTTRQ